MAGELLLAMVSMAFGGLIGLVIQPWTARRSTTAQDRWRAQKDLFEEAKTLVDWMYNFNARAQGNEEVCTDEPPHEIDINRVAAGLLLVSQNKEIPQTFLSLVRRLDAKERANMNQSDEKGTI